VPRGDLTGEMAEISLSTWAMLAGEPSLPLDYTARLREKDFFWLPEPSKGRFSAVTGAWFRRQGQTSAKTTVERSALQSALRRIKLVAGLAGMQEHCR
jgi:hypothetical protein